MNSGPRSRFAPSRSGGLRLGGRDVRLLTDLYLHGVMARHQLQALYFGSVPRCNSRLRQLFDGGFVTRRFLSAAPFGSEAVYGLGPSGVPVVAASLTAGGQEADAAAIRQQCRQGLSEALLEHTLAIAEFYVALRQATADPETAKPTENRSEAQSENQSKNQSERELEDQSKDQVEIERWLPELLCRHEYDIRRLGAGPGNGGGWHREVFKPDGFLRLSRPASGRQCSYFLEIDRGHVSSEKFVGKLNSHRRYLESGLFAEVYGDGSFRTLVITTSPKRLDNLLRAVEDCGEDLFWLATFEAVAAHGPLAPVWQVPGQAERTALI